MEQTVLRSSELREVSFHIEETPDSFQALSSGLYSDSIKAIIRELGTNAIDAHREAGNINQKVDVHLPTFEEPWYSIRDYGTGMPWELIETRYIIYFNSSKRKNNKTIGKFGLGCKSPFAYTKAFTVTSIYEGKKYNYSAFVSEGTPDEYDDFGNLLKEGQVGGFPHLAYLGECDENDEPIPVETDEQDGIEVKFAVENYSDFTKFHNSFISVYQFFPERERPRLIGKQVNIPNFSYILENKVDGWGILSYNDGRAMAIMGNIAYPINLSEQLNLTEHQKHILNSDIHIRFNIDQLDITPSRESLKNEPRTISRIIQRIDSIAKSLCEDYQKKFNDCKTLWEARVLYATLFGDLGLSNRLSKLMDRKSITWNGQELDSKGIDLSSVVGLDCKCFCMETYRWRKRKKRYNTNLIVITPQTNLYEIDEKNGYISKMDYALNNKFRTGYLFKFSSEEQKKEVCKLLSCNESEFIKTSTLTKPSVFNGGKAVYHKVFVRDISVNGNSGWSSTEIDIENAGFYVERLRDDINLSDDSEEFVSECILDKIIRISKELNLFDKNEEVIGFRRPIKKGVTANNWICFPKYIKEKILEKFKDTTFAYDYACCKFYKSDDRNEFLNNVITSKECPEYCTIIDKFNNFKDYNMYNSLLNSLNLNVNLPDVNFDIDKNIIKQYPLLTYLISSFEDINSRWYSYSDTNGKETLLKKLVKDTIDYIKEKK